MSYIVVVYVICSFGKLRNVSYVRRCKINGAGAVVLSLKLLSPDLSSSFLILRGEKLSFREENIY